MFSVVLLYVPNNNKNKTHIIFFDVYMSYGWGISQGRVTDSKLYIIIVNHVTMWLLRASAAAYHRASGNTSST